MLLDARIQEDGKRTILGASVVLEEHEIHWWTFMEQLIPRGFSRVLIIRSDHHTGLRAYQKAIFGGVPWLQCQFYIQQNPLATIPQNSMKAEGTPEIKAILNTPDMHSALEDFKKNVAKVKPIATKLAA